MTSGEFVAFPIDNIFVDRPGRQRKTLENIDELAASIHRVGLIHPPVIERNGNLRVGERRLTACKMLGWTSIPVQFVDTLDEHELKLLELEENLRRQNLSWEDECHAVYEYHSLRVSEDGWSMDKTAEALGVSKGWLVEHYNVAKELIKGNQSIIEAPRYTVAKNMVTRQKAREEASILHSISTFKTAPILHADFHAWATQPYDGPKFNFIHCDFPYGIGAHDFDQGSAAEMGAYEDSSEGYDDLIKTLELICRDRVHQSAHLMFWFSMTKYGSTMYKLEEMGWRIWDHPLIWHKSDNIGILSDPKRGPRNIYETCFFGSRGDRHIVRAVSNVVACPTTQSVHMSEKPVAMLEKFMSMFVDEYSVVLDPTCGSGSALRAARSLRAKHILGLESNEQFYLDAKRQYEVGDTGDPDLPGG